MSRILGSTVLGIAIVSVPVMFAGRPTGNAGQSPARILSPHSASKPELESDMHFGKPPSTTWPSARRVVEMVRASREATADHPMRK